MKKKISLIIVLTLSIILTTMNIYALNVEVDGKNFTIDENFSSSDIPEGFSEANISYEGTNVKGIANSDDSQFKFYLTNDEDSSLNGWYTYLGKGKFSSNANEGNGIAISGGNLIIEEPGKDVVIPKGIVPTTLEVGGNSYPAYIPKKYKDDFGEANYLVYGTLDGTEHAWYEYSIDDNMAVRTSIDEIGNNIAIEKNNKALTKKLNELSDKYNRNTTKAKVLFLFMCVATMLFLFLMINSIIKRKHLKMDLEDRILDLRIHRGRDTMKIGKKDLEKRQKADLKTMERNNIDPSEVVGDQPRKRGSVKNPMNELNNTQNDVRPKPKKNKDFVDPSMDIKPKSKPKDKTKDQMDFDIKSIEDNINNTSKLDFDDDIEFVSLDL